MRWLLALLCFSATAAMGQATPPPPTTARLDAILLGKDYRALGEAVSRPADAAALSANLDWLRDRMTGGASSYVALLYAQMLWNVGDAEAEPVRTKLRETAVLATLYAIGATGIDGQRCSDRTAPDNRVNQLLTTNPGLFEFYRAMPLDRRTLAVEGAMLVERRTATIRDRNGDVAFVCSGGLDEMTYNLSHGRTREVAPKPGQVGRQVEVIGDGSYRPGERPEREWRPAAMQQRAIMRQALVALAGPVN